MKLYYSSTSPFVRKCLVAAHELGLADRIELVTVVTMPTAHNDALMRDNPLCKLPTLITDEGQALYDSRVICEYLNDLGGGRLIPAGGGKWAALVDQSLADGILDAALLMRYEVVLRPAERQWPAWRETQEEKARSALGQFERQVAGWPADRLDIGVIALASALGYLDLRFPDMGWRDAYPGLAAWFAGFDQRPSMRATVLKA
ncbi:glutathione S-transferase [Castellaniella denitrificans]|uniref:Glutathione S-transferase n=1 Tax=Castellaniella denitrificans TaxID=56119 RepID=A0ABT4LZP3_9BURK|nr:glutathione S-transferase [Castellaniella denitrificans]MCZ4328533.1 glutathione S-transferase [Castellaniella denitrificans]